LTETEWRLTKHQSKNRLVVANHKIAILSSLFFSEMSLLITSDASAQGIPDLTQQNKLFQ
jgi:hypothetical protein